MNISPNGMGSTRPPSSSFQEAGEQIGPRNGPLYQTNQKIARMSPMLIGDSDSDRSSSFSSGGASPEGEDLSRSTSPLRTALPLRGSTDSLSARMMSDRLASQSSTSFRGASRAGETPEAADEQAITDLVKLKIAHLLPESLEISRLVEFLKQSENKRILEALEKNHGFHLTNPKILAQLSLRSPLEFFFEEGRYFSVEPLLERDQGYFYAAGSLMRVSPVLMRGLQDTTEKAGYAVRKVVKIQLQPEEMDRIDTAHQYAADLAKTGVALVASRVYRIAERLIIIQSWAPSVGSVLKGGIDSTEATKMLLSLSKAVVDLHANGLIHRDLKPDNFSVQFLEAKAAEGKKGKVEARYFLNDFDTLESILEARKTIAIGTPRYMAPEVCRLFRFPFHFRSEVSPPSIDFDLRQSDVWSFGMSALEILFHADKSDSNAEYPAHPFIELEDPNEYALMLHTARLKEEAGIKHYIEERIQQQPRLASVYWLVRETLYLDPAQRMPLGVFYEELQKILASSTER